QIDPVPHIVIHDLTVGAESRAPLRGIAPEQIVVDARLGLFGSNRPRGGAADVFLQEHEAIAFGAGLTGPRGPVRRTGRRSRPCEIEHDTAANHPDRLTVRASVAFDLLIALPLILDEARR